MLAFVVFMPLLVLALTWLSVEEAVWSHMATTLLPEVLLNTAILITGVSVGVLLLGFAGSLLQVGHGLFHNT